MPEYIDKCKKCYHFQVCANVMKNQLFIREKMLLEENPECEHFISAADVVEVRHGRWVEEGCGLLVCSKCNFEYDHSGMPFEGLYYCPKCGAKMDGDKNG